MSDRYMCHTIWGSFETNDGPCARHTWMPFGVLSEAEEYYSDPVRLKYAKHVTLYLSDGGRVIMENVNGSLHH